MSSSTYTGDFSTSSSTTWPKRSNKSLFATNCVLIDSRCQSLLLRILYRSCNISFIASSLNLRYCCNFGNLEDNCSNEGMNPFYQMPMGMSILKSIWGINTSVIKDDFNFYVDLYLSYFREVDDMALDKKKRFLRNLFKQFNSSRM